MRGIASSLEFWISFVVSIGSYGLWMTGKWADVAIGVLPNLLGFTLGGYAMFLGFGSDEFKKHLVERREAAEASPFMSVSAAFLLFVTVQLASLLVALVAAGLYLVGPFEVLESIGRVWTYLKLLGGFLGFWLFAYGLALAMRAAIRIFRLSRWYDFFLTRGAASPSAHAEERGEDR
jgi:hypothetical protein